MAKLTTATRDAIPSKKFALPGRRYPIEDRSHAANALSRVSQNGTPAEKAEVRSKVHKAYPGMGGKGGDPPAKKIGAKEMFGSSMSSKGASCPHCGQPMPEEAQSAPAPAPAPMPGGGGMSGGY